MKKIVVACLLATNVGMVSNSYAGIPVSVLADIPAMLNQVQTMAQWAAQLAEMKNQLDQQKADYEALNGLRDVGKLLNDDLLNQYLPKDYQQALETLMENPNGEYSGVTGGLASIVNQNQKYTCAALNNTASLIKQCEQQWSRLALDKNVGIQGYKKSAENIDNLQQYVNKITTSTDPKSLQDIQARIAVEQVRMQNEQVKLNTIKMMADADVKLKAQQHRDAFNAGMDLGAEGGISF